MPSGLEEKDLNEETPMRGIFGCVNRNGDPVSRDRSIRMIGGLAEKTFKTLNRCGCRTLLGLLASGYSTYKTKRLLRIFYDEAWIHKHLDGVIVDRDIRWQTSISRIIVGTLDYYFYIYRPERGDVVFDIGAGIGGETFVFSREVGPTGKVVSIEAHPNTFLCLTKMCEYNALDNVIPLNLAVAEKESEVFITDLQNPLSNTIVGKETGIKIKGMTLDKIVDDLHIDRIDFLKMNIEGAEKLAIKGMAKTIQLTKYICIACHDFLAERNGRKDMKTKRAITEFLSKNNFRIVTRENDKRDWIRDQVHGISSILG